jgi:hypothetical protein
VREAQECFEGLKILGVGGISNFGYEHDLNLTAESDEELQLATRLKRACQTYDMLINTSKIKILVTSGIQEKLPSQ